MYDAFVQSWWENHVIRVRMVAVVYDLDAVYFVNMFTSTSICKVVLFIDVSFLLALSLL